MKRIALIALLLGLGTGFAFAELSTDDVKVFRIGTGETGGTYYPTGAAIAEAISNPNRDVDCSPNRSCGVPGLAVTVQASSGSVANVTALTTGAVESAFVQSDIAYWAYNGQEVFADAGRAGTLRAMASLYVEAIHLVVPKDSDIQTVSDLRGKRVALDDAGSGTLVDARMVLEAYGLDETQFEAVYIPATQAVKETKEGRLDAFFLVAGPPTPAISDLALAMAIRLIPLTGPEADAVTERNPFLTPHVVAANTYRGVEETKTLSLTAQWITHVDQDPELIYQILAATWALAPELVRQRVRHGNSMRLSKALDGLAVPLHPGARRYYQDRGLLN